MAASDEALAELTVVVDLAVEDDHLRPVFVEDRLSPAVQVDDAETAHAEADSPADITPLVVGAAMPDCGAHLTQQRLGDGSVPVAVDDPSDAAHGAWHQRKSGATTTGAMLRPRNAQP